MSESGSYALDHAFEQALVTMLCSRPRFYGRIGSHIDPECLNTEISQTALKAAHAIAADKGNGPSSLHIVTQRLRRWMEEGKITQESINAVMDYFDEAIEAGLPDEEDVIAEIVPILQRRIHNVVITTTIDAYGKHGDLKQAAALIEKSTRLGVTNDTIGSGLEDAFDEIATIAQLKRLPTGILELDGALEGGPECGSSFVYVGGSGDGKSVILVQQAAEALINGYNVAYATLEVSKPRTFARLMANLTGIPMNGILNGSRNLAIEQYAKLKEYVDKRGKKPLGMFRIEEFENPTVSDIKAFVKRIEEKTGKKIHVVVVDYWDRGEDEPGKKSKDSSYNNMLHVFEDFRLWMKDENRWGFTASQATRRKDSKSKAGKGKGRLLDTEDGADSQNKVRVSDGWITLNVSHDGREVTFFVGKNRHGESRQTVGPLPTDWARGRIAPTNRPWDYDAPDVDDTPADAQAVFFS